MAKGRTPQGEYVGKSKVMGFRITPDTKTALDKAAKKADGHSLKKPSTVFAVTYSTRAPHGPGR